LLQALQRREHVQLLHDKRDAFTEEVAKEVIANATKAEPCHQKSTTYQELLQKPNCRTEALSKLTEMGKVSDGVDKHVVFCIDSSYSMQGQRWDIVVRAYQEFLDILQAGGLADRISVMVFDDKQNWQLKSEELTKAKEIPIQFQGGGTCFVPALRGSAERFIEAKRQFPHLQPVLVFLSDGEAADKTQVNSAIAHLKQTVPDIKVHTIFVGSDSGSDMLQSIAKQLGGQAHAAEKLEGVSAVFESIAESVSYL